MTPVSEDRFEQLARPCARGIYDLVMAQDGSLELNKHRAARIRETISVTLRVTVYATFSVTHS